MTFKFFYYHVIITDRSNIRYCSVVNALNKIARKFNVLAKSLSFSPYLHAHVIIRSKYNPFKFIRSMQRKYNVYIIVKPIKHQIHLTNSIKYVKYHNETFIKRNGDDTYMDRREIIEEIRRLERRINELRKQLNMKETENRIRLSKMTITLYEGNKGKALIINFPHYVEVRVRNKVKSIYINVTDEDLENLAKFFNQFRRRDNVEKEERKGRSVKGYRKALE